MVTVLPSGIIGWFRGPDFDGVRSLFGFPRRLVTYPRLEEDPEVQQEREELGQ